MRATLSRFLRRENGAITTDWAFLVVAGGMMAIATVGVILSTVDGFGDAMRGELGAPEPDMPLMGPPPIERDDDRGGVRVGG